MGIEHTQTVTRHAEPRRQNVREVGAVHAAPDNEPIEHGMDLLEKDADDCLPY